MFFAVDTDAAGDVFVGGFLYDANAPNGFHSALYKLAGADGAEIWLASGDTNTFADEAGEWEALAVDDAGDVYVAGHETGYGSIAHEVIVVAKYSGQTGEGLWLQSIGPGTARTIAVGEDGEVFVAGVRVLDPDNASSSDRSALVARIAADGSRVPWIQELKPLPHNEALALSLHPSGDVLVSGWSADSAQSDASSRHPMVARLDLERGQAVWAADQDSSLRAWAAFVSGDGSTVGVGGFIRPLMPGSAYSLFHWSGPE
jgi:hypothetical protein